MGMSLRLALSLSTTLSSVGFGPTWSADFLLGTTSGTLPAGVSVSSPSLGGLVGDSAGKLTYKPNNLLTYSNTFSNAAWNTSQVTLNPGVTDPLGGNNAWTVTASVSSSILFARPSASPAGQYLNSIWIRRRSGSGTIAIMSPDDNYVAVTVTGTWQQFSVAGNYTASSPFTGIRMYTAGDQVDVYNAVTAAVTYETTPRPGDQVITTSSAYYGPAWDRDSAGNALGLRVWESRTNYTKDSANLTTTNWSKGNITAGSPIASPDGTADFYLLTPSTGTAAGHMVYQAAAAGVTTGSPFVLSAIVKPSGYSQVALRESATVGSAAVFNLVGSGSVSGTYSGTNLTVSNPTISLRSDGSYVISALFTPGSSINVSAGIVVLDGTWASGDPWTSVAYSGDGVKGLYATHVNLQIGSSLGPPIPTGSAAVTAAADVATSTSLAAVGGFNANAGALVAEWGGLPTVATLVEIAAYNSTSFNNALEISKSNVTAASAGSYINLDTYDGSATVINLSSTAGNDGGIHRAGVTWGTSSLVASLDGGSPVSGTKRNPAPTKLNIGSREGSYYINGYIRKLAVYSSTLTNAQLVALSSWTFNPTWFGDFTTASLPSGVSVSSPSLGGLVTDATGKLTYKGNNALSYSNTYTNAVWHLSNATLTTGIDDPVGGNTATTITATGSPGRIYQGISANGIPTVHSIWVRRRSGTGTIQLMSAIATAGQTITPTSTWQQFSTRLTGGDGYAGIYVNTPGDQIDIYSSVLGFVTYETAPRAVDQVITGASAYYGPAFDYDPVSIGTPLGLRIWESRQNVLTYSNTFSNAAWTQQNGNSGAPVASIAGPDGITSGWLYTSNATGQAGSYQSVSLSAGNAYTVFAKAGTAGYAYIQTNDAGGTKLTWFNLSTGAVGTTNATGTSTPTTTQTAIKPVSYGNGWWRIGVVNTGATSVFFAFGFSDADASTIPANGHTAYFFGAQAEAASYAGPYIPTGSAAVTAAADVVTLTGTALSTLQGSAGAAIVEASGLNVAGTVNAILSTNNGAAVPIYYNSGGNSLKAYNGTTNLVANMFPAVGNTLRYGTSWSAAGRSLTNGGNAPASDSLVFSPAVTSVQIGGATGYSTVDGYVRKLAIYNQRIPDFALQQRTVANASFT